MKRFLPFLFLLFGVQSLLAQLTVKPSEKGSSKFIFSEGDLLFVGGGIHLDKNPAGEAEASIYLRREAQLLQKEDDVKNTGTGTISLYQHGQSNAFDYDYWTSPVAKPGTVNRVFGITMLSRPVSLTQSEPARITSGVSGNANPLTISSQWIYTLSGSGYDAWKYIGDRTEIPAGYGFTMKGVSGTDPLVVDGHQNNPANSQRYDFRGSPNTGKILVPVEAGELVLVGNPYPSAMDLSLFLLQNSGHGRLPTACYGEVERENVITGIAYFWDSVEDGDSHYLEDYIGGYGAFSPVDACTSGIYERPLLRSYGNKEKTSGLGKHDEKKILPIAQGFIVEGVQEGNILFSNSHRVFHKSSGGEDPAPAEKPQNSTTEIPKIQLQVSINDELTRSLSLAFWEAATEKVDFGMDAAAYDLAAADVGFLHHDQHFTIDVRPYEVTAEIPLFLKVESGKSNFAFHLTSVEAPQIKNIYILDSELNLYHDISEAPFELELPEGNYNSRFKLTFMKASEIEILPVALLPLKEKKQEFSLFQNNRLQELEIISDTFFPLKSVGIFDLHGRKLFFRSNFPNPNSISISTAYLPNAVYIVKVTDSENRSFTRKISVQNKI